MLTQVMVILAICEFVWTISVGSSSSTLFHLEHTQVEGLKTLTMNVESGSKPWGKKDVSVRTKLGKSAGY
jgi:hypothetical protein